MHPEYSSFHLRSVALLAEGVDRNRLRRAVAVVQCVALLAEGVDRNFGEFIEELPEVWSPSSRRAWIEIDDEKPEWTSLEEVALLAEGVDRNLVNLAHGGERVQVALLAEGVDRNLPPVEQLNGGRQSPSSRRAWIEIFWRSDAGA